MIEVNGTKIDVEFDGKYWHQNKERDDKRDAYMFSKGFKVLRIIGNHYIPSRELIEQSINELINNDIENITY